MMYGYVQMYFYLEFNDDTATISSIDMDFQKPISEEFVQSAITMFAKYYEKQGKKLVKTDFVTKEAYEAYRKKYPEGLSYQFNEDEITKIKATYLIPKEE